MKITLLFAVALALAGCATAPAPLRGEFASGSPDGVGSESTQATVRWGGSIIATEPGADQTCIEVLGRELNDSARPRATPDRSVGRFIACRSGFYDPAVFTPGREVTFVGRVESTSDMVRIGEYDYRLPRVAADVIYLWPKARPVDVRYPAPQPWPWMGWGWGSPWWGW